MDRANILPLTGLLVGTCYLSTSYQQSYAFDRPAHSATVVLALCGAAVLALERLLPTHRNATEKLRYEAIPLDDIDGDERPARRDRSPSLPIDVHERGARKNPRALRWMFGFLVVAVCARMEIMRRVIKDVECANRMSYEPLIPFVLAVADFWSSRKGRVRVTEDDPDDTIYDDMFRSVAQSSLRYVVTTLVMAVCGMTILLRDALPGSSYICPASLPIFSIVPVLQFFGFVLDALLVLILWRLLDRGVAGRAPLGLSGPRLVGLASLFSAAFWVAVGVVVYFAKAEYRDWMLAVSPFYVRSLAKAALFITLTVVGGLRCVHYYGAMKTAMIATFASIAYTDFVAAWEHRIPFPPRPSVGVVFVLLAFYVVFVSFLFIEASREIRFRGRAHVFSFKIPAWSVPFLILLFIGRTILWSSRPTHQKYHPVDVLIHTARVAYEDWEKQAASSNSIGQATEEYRQRYRRNPPPNFDKWYEYAITRESPVIDDFDNIYDDLLPFWAVSPEDIRQRTWEAIANQNNDAGGIQIRNGKASISNNVVPTHKWMLEGIIDIIAKFAEFLPDMDLAFNLNDESRVTVPYEEIERMKATAKRSVAPDRDKVMLEFSENRKSQWKDVPKERITKTDFVELSLRRTFEDFGSVGCPPDSPARTQRLWNVQDLCTSCTAPHSLGQFLQNWTVAADVCHQPDLADLHGLYLSPAAFKASRKLYPIFSQSKPGGFNDIRYPSAWNYEDKVAYEPSDEFPDGPFRDKTNALFWRGVTSEGVSGGSDAWRGMTRQRMVHLATNVSTPQMVLLPRSSPREDSEESKPTYFSYANVEPSVLQSAVSASVRFVSPIARCGGGDCADQAAEFGFAPRTLSFQSHWEYRFLLDADGAGFSGRFLPFLQSRSLPFKAALFREWWEGRVMAWKHFVPLDMRGQGLWSTLAYFAGFEGEAEFRGGGKGRSGTRNVAWPARENVLGQYKYAAMSNLVLQADRRFVSRRTDENTGDPESLAGRINIRDMGSRVTREDAPQQPSRKPKGPSGIDRGAIREGEDVLEREQKKRKLGGRDPASAGQLQGTGILSQDLVVEDLRYKPRTPATRDTYQLITTIVGRNLGDVPSHVTRSAADAILEYLKDEEMKDYDRKKEIDEILGNSMSPKEFNELVNLGKKITDYDAQDEDEEMAEAGEGGEEANLDERQGVAVVFDDSEEEEGGGQTFEVRDGADTSDEEEEDEGKDEDEQNGAAGGNVEVLGSDEEEEVVIGSRAKDAAAKTEDSKVVLAFDIDAYWLQRQIGYIYEDAHTQQEKTQEALQILAGVTEDGEEQSLRDIENDLMELFEYEHHELVEKLVLNRDKVVWVTRWRRAAEDSNARVAVEREMIAEGHRRILDELRTREKPDEAPDATIAKKMKLDLMDVDVPSRDVEMKDAKEAGLVGGLQPKKLINLENLVFDQGNHLMTNPNVKLPQGSTKRPGKGYEEIHVPPPKAKRDPSEPKNMPTSALPDWARRGFGSSKELNRIQTRCFPTAFNDDGNMLICAPTGSGKTNVAMLAMLREIGKHRNPETGEISLDDFKIIYIAPLKALVQEQVGNFGKRLEPYGIRVAELTGDRQLTKQQIAEAQIIVTTPEKWDVITRKATESSYTNLVRLICIDEIHLLHDDRGPVLESIVARTIRRTEQTGDPVRIVGLSATLPNYRDVASFLRVDPSKGLFHFDGSFRPCPLRQEFIGVTDRKPIKQLKTMNDVCYNKVLEQVGQNRNQMLIFVHSRKETAKTAKHIRDKALEMDTIGQILRVDAASREILKEEGEGVSNADLKDLMPYGFGIHHAGMSRADRNSVEELFSEGHLQVLVCTATLAWGVNLPAHTVIIKGTQVYSPEKGSWVELSPQDVLQMLGRAGRPQYDTFGEGIIITTQTELQYYLSLMNQQLPIESQFMSKLADNLNAEIVLGNVRSRDEGVEWLGYTYLFVRMLRSPGLYSVGADYEHDNLLEQKRVDLIHSAATILERTNLIKYEKRTGRLQSTELGRVASHYYISHASMLTYNMHIQPSVSTIELFRIFALSEEFKYIPVRQEEKLEISKLVQSVPIPVKEGIDEPHAKINVLLQAYISRLKLEGLALMADMVYVTQSAGRILRAIFDIALKKGWASVAKTALDLCKMAEKRMWPIMTPLRQFPNCSRDIIQKAERIDVPWSSYFDLDPPRMGELLGMPKAGKTVCSLVSKFPRLEIQAQVQPMTRSLLRVELSITPSFEWDNELHGAAEGFWILAEDCDGEEILFHDQFLLRREYAMSEMNEHLVEFTVPITDPMPPNYFITVVSDRWMHSETKIAVSFQKLILPEKFPPHTPLLDLQPLPVSALKLPEYQELYHNQNWDRFNKVQTQVFNSLFSSDDNVFVGASAGMGKTVCAEFALLRHWAKPEAAGKRRAVYIAPFQELVDTRLKDWQGRLSGLRGGKQIVKLTGETTADLRLLDKGDVILATPSQWDVMSRQWQRRKNVQSVGLFIADELHMIGGQGGYTYETIVSRMQAMTLQLESELRIVGLSVSLSNARDIGEWIGASKHTIFNFSPHVRSVPLELHVQSFSIPHFPSLMLAMAKPAYQAVLQLAPDKPAIIFVPSRKQVRATALDILANCVADDDEDRFLHASVEDLAPVLERVDERALADSLSHGIAYYHEALTPFDKRAVEHFFKVGAVQLMLVSRDCCWEINCNANFVIVMGTQFFEGREHRYLDYPISEVLQMFGKAGRTGEDKTAKGMLMVPAVKRDYYKKFLNEALPIESHLQHYLPDAFVAEVSTKVIGSTQDAVDWMTYTYFYRRLLANPSYYGLTDTTHDGLSAFLSELVENTLKELIDAKIIELDEEDDTVTPLNPAMIAAYYNISFVTMQTLLLSLNSRTKRKGILEIITSATEFEGIQIRRHEDHILRRIYDRVPIKMVQESYESPHFKAFILLQAYFSRMQLPVDLGKDQDMILSRVLPLLQATVDVLSSDGHLNAIAAMEMSQMVVQAMWDRDSPLKQIPHFDNGVVKAASEFGISDISEFLDKMDPDSNPDYDKLVKRLGLSQKQLADAAAFTNESYPNLDLEFEVEDADEVAAGSPALLNVNITRELDEDEEPRMVVHAPFFPGEKTENWWLVVGEESSKSLLAIKRITVGRQLKTKLEFVVPSPGRHKLMLYLMCDSYVGVDQALEFDVEAAEGMDEDESEDEE
ncbi:Sec63 Brl domain-containing protein [Lineolata rhizophorae]|uniref:Sec63 Brl domain-containing protein n=1 Tax=Lineolata rhizophorae TaxID=578093 RepID=A0A6A6NLP6_9PEZI|nr:Sec63 Brl domain-containing protein [Lineolata rhizophorae]